MIKKMVYIFKKIQFKYITDTKNKTKRYVFLICFVSFSFFSFSQFNKVDLGFNTDINVEKELYQNLVINIAEELRLESNEVGFDRNVITVGLDYSIFNKSLEFGVYYAFIYTYNNENIFEPRNRLYTEISYKHSFEQFKVSWRSRLQATYIKINEIESKINQNYHMKNKLEIAYVIKNKAFTPFLSCDISTNLNGENSYGVERLRFKSGTAWHINGKNTLYFFIKWDEYLDKIPNDIVALGVSYFLKL